MAVLTSSPLTLQQTSNRPVSSYPPALPCKCPGTLPGRSCSACFSSKWLKRCQHCMGNGFYFGSTRQGNPKREPCAECRRGWKPCMPRETEQARQDYAAWMIEQGRADELEAGIVLPIADAPKPEVVVTVQASTVPEPAEYVPAAATTTSAAAAKTSAAAAAPAPAARKKS